MKIFRDIFLGKRDVVTNKLLEQKVLSQNPFISERLLFLSRGSPEIFTVEGSRGYACEH